MPLKPNHSRNQSHKTSQPQKEVTETFHKISEIMSGHEQLVFRNQQERTTQLSVLLAKYAKEITSQSTFSYFPSDYEKILGTLTPTNLSSLLQQVQTLYPDFAWVYQELSNLYQNQSIFQERIKQEFLIDLLCLSLPHTLPKDDAISLVLDENMLHSGVLQIPDLPLSQVSHVILAPLSVTSKPITQSLDSLTFLDSVVSISVEGFLLDTLPPEKTSRLIPLFQQAKICKWKNTLLPLDSEVRQSLLSSMNGLKYLEISSPNHDFTDFDLRVLFSNLPFLRFLSLDVSLLSSHKQIISVLSRLCSRLGGLEIRSLGHESTDALQGVLGNANQLKYLGLKDSSFFSHSDQEIHDLFSHLDSLQNLDLSGSYFADQKQLESILRCCHSLVSLTFRSAQLDRLITNWESLVEAFPSTLRLVNFEQRHLFSMTPRLRSYLESRGIQSVR